MTPIEVAARLIGLLLDLLPHQTLKVLLDDEARKRANLIADAAEVAKFGDHS